MATVWVLEGFSKQMNLKNNFSLYLSLNSQKREHHPYMALVVSMTKEGKLLDIRWAKFGYIYMQTMFSHSENSFRRKHSQRQLVSSDYYLAQDGAKILNIKSLRSEFFDQISSKMKNLYLLHEALFNYSLTQESVLDPRKLIVHYILHPAVNFTSD